MIQTIEHEGKIFAVECGCRERGGWCYTDRERVFKEQVTCYADGELVDACTKCIYNAWIILPKDMVADKYNEEKHR
jgi:hypothetical protein